jgi:hypothetical protein
MNDWLRKVLKEAVLAIFNTIQRLPEGLKKSTKASEVSNQSNCNVY